MKTPKEAEPKLKSSFYVTGRLKVQSDEFSAYLQSAPFLHLTSANKPTTYSIIQSEENNGSELQVLNNKLTFSYRFHRSSVKEYARNLLKFISILAYVSDLYEPELASLYPNITEVLVGYIEEMPYVDEKIQNGHLVIRQIKTLSEMNCSLSLKMLQLQLKCQKLEAEKASLLKFSKDVIENAMGRLSVKDPNSEILPKVLGTTTEAYSAIRPAIFDKGR